MSLIHFITFINDEKYDKKHVIMSNTILMTILKYS